MDKIIEWYNAGEIITLSVTVGDIFNYSTILEIDNIAIWDDVVNIMVGEMNIDLSVTDFIERENGLYYTEGGVSILLTI